MTDPNRQQRRAGAARRGPLGKVPLPILVLTTVLVVALGVRFAATRGGGDHHPTPREDVTAAGVIASARYAGYPQIVSVYDQAREIPDVLDGLFCYCDCAEHFGHRSLLTCFESDHGAGCDICLQEAALAYRMTRDGESLKTIRAAVDAMFSS